MIVGLKSMLLCVERSRRQVGGCRGLQKSKTQNYSDNLESRISTSVEITSRARVSKWYKIEACGTKVEEKKRRSQPSVSGSNVKIM